MCTDPFVLLIHPPYGKATKYRIFQPGIEFPISLAYLSAYLKKNDIQSNVVDMRIDNGAENIIENRLKTMKPLAVGITASTANIGMADTIAARVKSFNSEVPIIIGGWHASALPRETLQVYRNFDYLIHGEGELALTNLVKCLNGGKSTENLKSLAYRKNGEIKVNQREKYIKNLNDIPFPCVEGLQITRYRPAAGTRNYLSLPSIGIMVGRGCPYRCMFCYKGVWGNNIRYRSAENVLTEIEKYIDQYGIRDFRFYDDTLTFTRWDLEGFCSEVNKRNMNISWNCWSRVNDVNHDKLVMMKEAGCYHIKFGIEFGTEKALNLSRKDATLDQARRTIALCKKIGIECKGSFIFGIPGETIEDCNKTIKFAKEISPHFATFYPFDPIPGSPYHNKIVKGEIDVERDMLPPKVTKNLANKAYLAFYCNPTFVIQRLAALCRHPRREGKMILSGLSMAAIYGFRSIINSFKNIYSNRGYLQIVLTEGVRTKKKQSISSIFKSYLLNACRLFIALFALVISLPVIAIIAILIKFSSRGPIIFKQTRIGKNYRHNAQSLNHPKGNSNHNLRENDLGGKPFTFYKFRTMYYDASIQYPELYRYQYSLSEIDSMYFKIPDDPRLTWLGKHLRRTTLDELPNFINVIKGDMNIIGPRPDIPQMVKYYRPWQKVKFEVKPGITGLAQVKGRGLLTFQETLKYDVQYVENRNLFLDLRILWKTIKVSVLRIGAF